MNMQVLQDCFNWAATISLVLSQHTKLLFVLKHLMRAYA